MNLTNSQKKALVSLKKLYLQKETNKVYFKAPTGSGKTLIASSFLNFIIEENNKQNKGVIAVFATISSASLPKQLAFKLQQYLNLYPFQNYKIQHLQSPSMARSNKYEDYQGFTCNYSNHENKIFVVGTSSFTKNSIFTNNNELNNLMYDIKHNKYQLIYFRDEAHIGGDKKDKTKNNEAIKNLDKIKDKADFIFQMTATPPINTRNYVEITEKDLLEDNPQFLLKMDSQRENFNDVEMSDQQILAKAIFKFKEMKTKYAKLAKVSINPAMLIQVSNYSKLKKEQQFLYNQTMKIIEQQLQANNLVYLKYKTDEKGSEIKVYPHEKQCPNNLAYASLNDSIIDVIIFKVGPATGWDIPRANMLVQLRNVCSDQLNIQTIGRIKRNPMPNLAFNYDTNQYFLYSNYQEKNKLRAFYKLKAKFYNKCLYRGKINKEDSQIEINKREGIKNIKKYLGDEKFKSQIDNFNVKEDFIYFEENINESVVKTKILNYFWLKIYLKNQESQYGLDMTQFQIDFQILAKEKNVSVELVEYLFFRNINTIKSYENESNKWVHSEEPYNIFDDANLAKRYDIWIDNKNQIDGLDQYQNYGYVQIKDENDTKKYIQHLDSNPEKVFLKRLLNNQYFKNNEDDISFFAKMPTFGSRVYFEYFSEEKNDYTRTYIDFAIKYKEKVIMVEIKSKDNDYDFLKTSNLREAYKMYMQKAFKQKNVQLILALCTVDKNNELEISHFTKDRNWVNHKTLNGFLKNNFQ